MWLDVISGNDHNIDGIVSLTRDLRKELIYCLIPAFRVQVDVYFPIALCNLGRHYICIIMYVCMYRPYVCIMILN